MNKIIILVIIVIVLIIAAVIYFTMLKNNNMPAENQNQENSTSFEIQGMKVEILKQGTGEGAKAGDNIAVDYVGTLPDGAKFDSSIDRKQPFPYTLGQNRVIQGWELGLLGMKVGEKRKLIIPPELGYGSQGRPPVIPPNAILIFEIDLLKIN